MRRRHQHRVASHTADDTNEEEDAEEGEERAQETSPLLKIEMTRLKKGGEGGVKNLKIHGSFRLFKAKKFQEL